MKKICSKCGKSKSINQFYKESRVRDGRMSRCKICHNEIMSELRKGSGYSGRYYRKNIMVMREYYNSYEKTFRKENPIIVKERDRLYRESHKAKIVLLNKNYYATNKKQELERVKKYQHKNRAMVSKRERKYRELHRDRYREYGRRWYQKAYATLDGRASYISRNMTRRVREQKAGSLTTSIIRSIENKNVIKYGILTCEYCKIPVGTKYHLEHKIPISRGGKNKKVNLCIACPQCNLSKGTLTADEYRKRLKVI